MTKYIVILILSMGLFAGPASAVTVTPGETITLGDGNRPSTTPGIEKDTWGEDFTVAAGNGDYEHVAYVLMEITQTLEVTLLQGYGGGHLPGQAVEFQLSIYAAYDAGNGWDIQSPLTTAPAKLVDLVLEDAVSKYWILGYTATVPRYSDDVLYDALARKIHKSCAISLVY